MMVQICRLSTHEAKARKTVKTSMIVWDTNGDLASKERKGRKERERRKEKETRIDL